MKKIKYIILIILPILLLFIFTSSFTVTGEQICEGNANKITVVDKVFLFFSNVTVIRDDHKDFDLLMRKAKEIVKNSYGSRKTFKKNDLSRTDHVAICFSSPLEINSSSFGGKIIVSQIALFHFSSKVNIPKINIPVVINNELPLYSKHDDYEKFILLIESIKKGYLR